MDKANIINDLYEQLTDCAHDGENSIATIDGVEVEAIGAASDAVLIDLRNGTRLVVLVQEERQ